jgi:hypothetical protein
MKPKGPLITAPRSGSDGGQGAVRMVANQDNQGLKMRRPITGGTSSHTQFHRVKTPGIFTVEIHQTSRISKKV